MMEEKLDAAEALLSPLLGSPKSRNDTAFFLAMNKLQTAHPDLSAGEIEALVAAVVHGI